jgi:hypothetical protein
MKSQAPRSQHLSLPRGQASRSPRHAASETRSDRGIRPQSWANPDPLASVRASSRVSPKDVMCWLA